MKRKLNWLALAVIAAGGADLVLAERAHALIEEPTVPVYCCRAYGPFPGADPNLRCCYNTGCQIGPNGCEKV
jgi:hypothetical protein